ncbi:MAG: 30S ribosomal protein S12 methylthiotransferase RimO [Clostridiales bacterium]|nr:30S ribosomal protein S12 methylthiotransferase RimO [Clostridiales bacterium]
MYKVGFISLGCSKNLVDTEMIIGLMKNANFEIVNNEKDSDIIVINTCGFINDAKEESINTILEMIEYKNKKCKYIIVVGCLAKRYKQELEKLIPEVDLFIGPDEYNNLPQILNNLIQSKENEIKGNLTDIDRVITTPKYMAYLKIAEGCDNRCTYCAIPAIRGKYISRPIESIIEEAEKLNKNGVTELVVIAQDTSKYGIDIYGEYKLDVLMEKLAKIGFKWIRMLYTYPESINKRLIKVIKDNPNICPYFDIPIQHISNNVLKRMGRKTSKEQIAQTIEDIRKELPNVVLRTTVMVGFPGETQEDFDELYSFVKNTRFDRLGVFKYSKEENTPAEKLKGHLHHMTKLSRYNKIMQLQQKISLENNENKIGNKYIMLVENIRGNIILGRTYMDSPEIDGMVKCKNDKNKKINIGDYIEIEITNCNEYDLYGKVI